MTKCSMINPSKGIRVNRVHAHHAAGYIFIAPFPKTMNGIASCVGRVTWKVIDLKGGHNE